MLSTSNYIARQFGVRAAMPGFIARKLCPNLKIVPPDFEKYRTASSLAQDVFRSFDPNFRMMSLDEAYLDLSVHMSERQSSSAEWRTVHFKDDNGLKTAKVFDKDIQSAVEEMRFRVFVATKLTCSAGIASNCLLAKICSDKNKPNGQFCLESNREDIVNFMKDLSIRSVNGIGKVTESLLNGLGVKTCGDLFDKRNELFLLFSKTSFQYFLRVSLGVGAVPDPDDGKEERKSMSCERTFKPLSEKEELIAVIKSLSDELSHDLSKANLYGQSLTLKIKLSSFVIKTRAVILPYALHDAESMFNFGRKILDRFLTELKNKQFSVRLMGLRMAKFAKKGTVSSSKKSVSNNTSIDKLIGRCNRDSITVKRQAEPDLESQTNINLDPLNGGVSEDKFNGLHETTTQKDVDDKEDARCLMEQSGCLFDEENVENKMPELDTLVESVELDSGAMRDEQFGEKNGADHNQIVQEINSQDTIAIIKQNTKPDYKNTLITSSRVSIKNVEANETNNANLIPKEAEQSNSNPVPLNSTIFERNVVDQQPGTSREFDMEQDIETNDEDGIYCPICGQLVPADVEINAHVDNCLAVIEVRNVLKEQAGHSNARTKTIVGKATNATKNEQRSPKDEKHKTTKKRSRGDFSSKGLSSTSNVNDSSANKKRHKNDKGTTIEKSDSQASLNTFLRRR
ncbi:uncharacterized protein LOC142336360 isoform X2 [Convolutriloba macropyga]